MSMTMEWVCPNGHANQEVRNSHQRGEWKPVCGACGAEGEQTLGQRIAARLIVMNDVSNDESVVYFTLPSYSFEIGRTTRKLAAEAVRALRADCAAAIDKSEGRL